MTEDLVALAQRWLSCEPDDDIADELGELIERAQLGEIGPLAEHFDGRLQFGTAGLRAAVGAGPMRMNRLVVRQAAAGLARWILDQERRGLLPDGARRGVAIGYDARRKSDLFALDTARVLAAAGVRARLLPGVQPTPVLAWSITGLGAAAGVVVTASHNPPVDNGYKVFLATGSQIVDPVDLEISAFIGALDPLSIELSEPDDPLIEYLGEDVVDAYADAVPAVRLRPGLRGATVAYTALHGVGGAMIERAFAASGFEPPIVVAAQHQPDGSFPTVPFPNPEEPGAMDLLMELAASCDATVALANDPDADRLGAAIPQADGSWRRLTGDEIGWLFAEHILAHTSGSDRLVVTTIVSSSLLSRMAAQAGVDCVETFTGFKWIGRTVTERPASRFVFGYEQALGYLVTQRPLDKDGITAAVLMAEIAALAVAEGVTLQDRLDDIATRFGRYVTAERSVRLDPAVGAQWVRAIEAGPPSDVGGRRVDTVTSFPQAGLVRLMLAGGIRLQIRPSGTEPKVKLYAEGVESSAGSVGEPMAAVLQAALAALAATAPL
jgi:phosphomannomutase